MDTVKATRRRVASQAALPMAAAPEQGNGPAPAAGHAATPAPTPQAAPPAAPPPPAPPGWEDVPRAPLAGRNAPAPATAPDFVCTRPAADARDADARVRGAGIVESADAARGGPRPFTSLPTLGAGYGEVQERVFTLPDPNGEYDDLERAMRLGTREFDSVSKALDDAEDNARRAHKLYVNARLDFERFTIDADLIEAAMWTQAQAELQKEKDAGQRSKSITEADTKHKCLALFPDEYRDLAERRIKGRKMLEHLERFADLWKTRCFSLAKQLEARR